VDGTGLGMCSVTDFGIIGAGCLGSAAISFT
jgi:hypothetical protein